MCVLFGSNYKYNIKTTRLTTNSLVYNVNKHVEMNHQQTADDSLLNMIHLDLKKEFSALLKITTALHITVPTLP